MKFAKELERELVPEWRAKYFDYKGGKKKVKAVRRALKSVNSSPKTPGRQLPSNLLANTFRSPIRSPPSPQNTRNDESLGNRNSGLTSYGSSKPTIQGSALSMGMKPGDQKSPLDEDIPEEGTGSTPIPITGRSTSRTALESSTLAGEDTIVTDYGSIVPSPVQSKPMMGPPALELPDPALPTEEESFARHNRAWRQSRFIPNPNTTPPSRQLHPNDAGVDPRGNDREVTADSPLRSSIFRERRANSVTGALPTGPPKLMKRIFTSKTPESPEDVPLEAYREVDARKAEFFNFLDKELEMIESFYKLKEAQATARLQVLRGQLHEMRDRRIQEIREEQMARVEAARHHSLRPSSSEYHSAQYGTMGANKSRLGSAVSWIRPIEHAIGVGPARIGKTSKSLQNNASPLALGPERPETWGDFTRRPSQQDDVPYRSAKRKLKLALQEFYRGLELLKAYALTNRTAFRKINKKYDKAVNARPVQRYMSEKVNKAWFVQSEVLEGQLVAVEDLYARYFERGNHKVAVGKLRSKSSRAGDFTGVVFRNGLMLAGGLVFGIQGIVYGADYLDDPDPVARVNASYLIQLYGGYFLSLLLFLLFCLDCSIWTRAKINYPFIFEFDTRHSLDWHQLPELACFFTLLLGVFIWLNFQQETTNAMFLYWPVLLIGITVITILLPAPLLYHQSREWWAFSNFRLLLAGIFPVEFRDFFLGDMYCSQTYSMGNIELFFCLYANDWINPGQCNSSHSRLLGFFTTLPAIWRFFQCLRRYYDTRNVFPHLANCGKYTFTILFNMTLSIYRIDKSPGPRALFITCATINSIYCSVWDLAMDWSLCNYYAEHIFLRKVLGFKYPWAYYTAMIVDPILRFNWIFYAIYAKDVQHSAVLAFFVGLSEVCRRGMWSLFRVENEHCTNVGRFRASRDVPLPYDLKPLSPSTTSSHRHRRMEGTTNAGYSATGVDDLGAKGKDKLGRSMSASAALSGADAATTSFTPHLEAQPSTPSLRRRYTPANTPVARGIARVGTIMTEAHAQDFERKRPPLPSRRSGIGGLGGREGGGATGGLVGIERSPHHGGHTVGLDSSDEEEEEEDVEIDEEMAHYERAIEEDDVDEMQNREDMAATRRALSNAGGAGVATASGFMSGTGDGADVGDSSAGDAEGASKMRRRSTTSG